MGLISASNPQVAIIDLLGKFSHDDDPGTACNAIFGLGLVGAGEESCGREFST